MTLHISPVNLILIVTALAAILSDFDQGLVITLIGGLLLDFVSGQADGLVSMSLLIVFLVMHLVLSEILAREPNRFIIFASIVGSTVIYFLAFLGVDKLFQYINLAQKVDANYLLTVQLPLTLMWNLFFAYPVFRYYTWVQNLSSKLPTNEQPIRT